jgi:hypothetical protein
MSFSAGVSISEVLLGIWVLNETLDVVFGLVVAGNIAVVNGDVAVAFGGSRCGTGVLETSWGELGRLGGFLGRRLEFPGVQCRSTEWTTCFDEHTCSSSCNIAAWVVDHSCMLFRTWQSVHRVVAVVCVLDETRVVVSRVVAADNVAVVGSDVAVAVGGSERETRGW